MFRTSLNSDKNHFYFIIISIIFIVTASIIHKILFLPIILLIIFFFSKKLFHMYTIPFLSIYLLFIPIGFKNFNIYFVVAILVGTFYIICNFKETFDNTGTKIYLCYLIGLLPGLLYSPDLNLGITLTFYNLLGLFALIIGQQISKNYSIEGTLRNILLICLPLGILNIVFLLKPDLEITFLNTLIAKLLIDPGALSVVLGDGYNNILDPRKAGTIFVNTNVAAVFFGILFWLSISLFAYTKNKSYLFFTLIYLSAELCTNSRAGIGAILFTLLILILLNINKRSTWTKILIFSLPAIIIGVIFINSGLFDNIVDRLSAKDILNDPRMIIWRFAFENIHPILGLGYGGWELISYKMGAGFYSFPPHNNFLIVWSWSGLFGVFALLILLFGFMLKTIKSYILTKNKLYIILIGAYSTVFFQGLFDNYFLHDYRITSLLFLITGLVFHKKID